MVSDPDQSRIATVQDEAQSPFVSLDFGPLFAAARGRFTASESTEDSIETTDLSASVKTQRRD